MLSLLLKFGFCVTVSQTRMTVPGEQLVGPFRRPSSRKVLKSSLEIPAFQTKMLGLRPLTLLSQLSVHVFPGRQQMLAKYSEHIHTQAEI